jgi:hypothetical protein
MSREVLKVFCPKGNEVGTVVADTGGYAVAYTASVRHDRVLFGSAKRVIDRLTETDELGQIIPEVAPLPAFCRSCKRPVTINPRELWAAVLRGANGIAQPFADGVEKTADKAWGMVGREPLYRPDEKWKRHDPRGRSEN